MDHKKLQFFRKVQSLKDRLIEVDGIRIDPWDCDELETHLQHCLNEGAELGKTLEVYQQIRHLTKCGECSR